MTGFPKASNLHRLGSLFDIMGESFQHFSLTSNGKILNEFFDDKLVLLFILSFDNNKFDLLLFFCDWVSLNEYLKNVLINVFV